MYNFTNRDIKMLVKEAISGVKTPLMELLSKINVRENGITMQDVEDGITLYHRPVDRNIQVGLDTKSVIDNIFTHGFDREFTSSHGGNMYGPGLYTVYKLDSSQNKAKGYGRNILKLKLLGGFKDFLILSMQEAKKVYGDNWKPGDQIRYLMPDKAEFIFNQVHAFIMNDDENPLNSKKFDKDGNELRTDVVDGLKSAHTLLCIVRAIGKGNFGGRCRGAIYNGNQDGDCCLVFDFQSVVPVAVSSDNGQTWENRLTQELLDNISSSVDTGFQYGQRYTKIADKCINGYTMVWDENDKVNYIPLNSEEPISDVWFDEGFNWSNNNGDPFVEVEINGYDLFIVYEDGTYNVYSSDWEPQCELSELKSLL